jgi:amino acid adenylation domain-containing protein
MPFEKTTIETSIPNVFARQVARYGNRPAIVEEGGSITYQQLDRLANCVAGALTANGHRHGQTVAILLEQGILQIATILGVLKAGGIYVPLDIALGRQRLRKIQEHAAPQIILTDQINRSTATLIGGGQKLVLNIEDNPEQFLAEFRAVNLSPDDSAYIYYTSGTTGEPKGVVDTHRNVLHNIARYTDNLNVDCDDRLTLLQSCGFSGAVSNIFTSLLNGAVLLPFDVRRHGVSALAKWLALQKPTVYHSVPLLFRQLMRYCDTLPTLRVIRLEGDMARPADIETFNRHFNDSCTLVNGLGATETGITAQYFIRNGTSPPDKVVPVGEATEDIRIDVVDTQNRPLSRGQFGEIVITSPYLAKGYWRRSDLTRSAFLVSDDNTRSYRTGDLGRIDSQGLLEVHGRVNSLSKIRGEWVDLSAVEATVTAAPRKQAARPETPMERLVAGVFERTLNIGSIGRKDDFFELGGDSLKAVEACVEICRLTGSNQALGALQHASTVADLAGILSDTVSRGCLVPLQSQGDGGVLFSVHAHMGHVFNLRQLAAQFAPERRFFGLQAKGLDGIDRPDTTLDAMAATYVNCIRKIQPKGPYLIAGYCFGSWVAVEMARQLRLSGEHVMELLLIDPQPPSGLLNEEQQRGDLKTQSSHFLARVRGLTMKKTARAIRSRVTEAAQRLRVRLLWLVAHRLPDKSRLARLILHRPADAIAIMQLDYQPLPYEGDACVLVSSDHDVGAGDRRAWESYIKGALEFESLVGNSTDLLRDPYTRDLAAQLLGRINSMRDPDIHT